LKHDIKQALKSKKDTAVTRTGMDTDGWVCTDPPPTCRRLAGTVFNLNSSECSSAFWIYTLITIFYRRYMQFARSQRRRPVSTTPRHRRARQGAQTHFTPSRHFVSYEWPAPSVTRQTRPLSRHRPRCLPIADASTRPVAPARAAPGLAQASAGCSSYFSPPNAVHLPDHLVLNLVRTARSFLASARPPRRPSRSQPVTMSRLLHTRLSSPGPVARCGEKAPTF
jgi:hypothetical protein